MLKTQIINYTSVVQILLLCKYVFILLIHANTCFLRLVTPLYKDSPILPRYSPLTQPNLFCKAQTQPFYLATPLWPRLFTLSRCIPLAATLLINAPFIKPRNTPFIELRNVSFVKPRNVPFVRPKNAPFVKPRNAPFIKPRNAPFIRTINVSFVNPRNAPFIKPRNAPFIKPRNTPFIELRNVSFVKPRNVPFVRPKNAPFVKPRNAPFIKPRNAPFIRTINVSFVNPRNAPFIKPRNAPFVKPLRAQTRTHVSAMFVRRRQPRCRVAHALMLSNAHALGAHSFHRRQGVAETVRQDHTATRRSRGQRLGDLWPTCREAPGTPVVRRVQRRPSRRVHQCQSMPPVRGMGEWGTYVSILRILGNLYSRLLVFLFSCRVHKLAI